MSIDKIIQSIRNNKQNHLVDFRLKSKTEDFTNALFHILFDSKISVRENIDALADSFLEISQMLDEQERLSFDLIWKKFMVSLPDLLKQLNQDAKCIYLHDPAARSVEEVILAYPGFFAIAVYRLSHEFHSFQMPLIPRMMSEYAHRLTGIDIHPGAIIGSPFFIDHGTGVVIGSCFYQDRYTMGSISFEKDLLKIALIFIAGPFDGSFDIVLGHIDRLGILNNSSQTRITVRIWPTFLYGHNDVFSNTRKRF